MLVAKGVLAGVAACVLAAAPAATYAADPEQATPTTLVTEATRVERSSSTVVSEEVDRPDTADDDDKTGLWGLAGLLGLLGLAGLAGRKRGHDDDHTVRRSSSGVAADTTPRGSTTGH